VGKNMMRALLLLALVVSAAWASLSAIARHTENVFHNADLPFAVKEKHYQRGLLEAEASQLVALAGLSGLPRVLRLEHHIEHTLLATPTRIRTHLFNADDQFALLPPGHSLAEVDTHLKFDGSGASQLHIPAFRASGLHWDAGTGHLTFNAQGVQVQATLPNLSWQDKGFDFNARALIMTSQSSPAGQSGNAQLGAFSQYLDDFEIFAADSVILNWEVQSEDGNLSLIIDARISQLRLAGVAYHAALARLEIKRIDPQSFYELLQALAALRNSDKGLRWMVMLKVFERAQTLLRAQPEVTITRLELQDRSGQIAFNGNLHGRSVDSALARQSPLMFWHALDVAVQLDISQEFLSDVAHTQLQSAYRAAALPLPDNIRAQARQQVENLLYPLHEKGYIRLIGTGYRVHFALKQGRWQGHLEQDTAAPP
jgi:uncharacterized protein YdgA (DUF945 family)